MERITRPIVWALKKTSVRHNHEVVLNFFLEAISKMSFGLPPFSAGLVPRFKSSTYNSMPPV
jgi:hypothetical protein